MPADFVDPYVDPETGVLRNLVGAATWEELARAEGEFAAGRTGELLERAASFRPTGTLEDLCAIHRALFQDVYEWAGRVRTVEIRKSREGSEFFLPSASIATGIEWSRGELRRDGMLKGMPFGRFVERLAYHYDNYNFVHPFREGNGRTQRVFWSLLCRDAGYDLDWRRAGGEENDEASRLAAEERDFGPLVEMLGKVASPRGQGFPADAGALGSGHLGA